MGENKHNGKPCIFIQCFRIWHTQSRMASSSSMCIMQRKATRGREGGLFKLNKLQNFRPEKKRIYHTFVLALFYSALPTLFFPLLFKDESVVIQSFQPTNQHRVIYQTFLFLSSRCQMWEGGGPHEGGDDDNLSRLKRLCWLWLAEKKDRQTEQTG